MLLNGYDHASISKSPKNEEYKVITILSTLENWDNAPEIVKKHLIEQENSQKELEHIIAKLEKELEEKRKCFIQKEFDLSFARLEES